MLKNPLFINDGQILRSTKSMWGHVIKNIRIWPNLRLLRMDFICVRSPWLLIAFKISSVY